MSKLREWYKKMLLQARQQNIVIDDTDIYTEVEHIKSVRDFPLFSGDLFPDEARLRVPNKGPAQYDYSVIRSQPCAIRSELPMPNIASSSNPNSGEKPCERS